jgi:hypothetical protein
MPHHKMPTGLVVAIVILCVTVVGVVVTALLLTRHVKKSVGGTVNFNDCKQEVRFQVKSANGKEYWLGALTTGMTLFTSFQLTTDGGAVLDMPYTLTAFGVVHTTGHVTSPMMGNGLATTSKTISGVFTPPPPPAVFKWSLLNNPTLAAFQAAAVATQTVDVKTGGGDPLMRLVVMSLPAGGEVSGDVCFLCTAPTVTDPAGWQPLTVLGGLVWKKNGDPSDPTTVYNLGCMPLQALLKPAAGAPAPGIAWLNVYPRLPLIGFVAPQDTTGTANNLPNLAQTMNKQPYALACQFDAAYQAQTGQLANPKGLTYQAPAQISVPLPAELNTVLGCSALPIPAFDMLSPAAAAAPNTRKYLDAIFPVDKAADPMLIPISTTARVGLTSAMGMIRTRKWPLLTDKSQLAEVLRASNPDVTTAADLGDNPYSSEVHPVPAQYKPQKFTQNAVTLVYPPSVPANSDVWALTYPVDAKGLPTMCQTTGEHVRDPAVVNSGTTIPQVPDEPILAVFYRPSLYKRGSTVYGSAPRFALGWGTTTGILYLRCGQSTTSVVSPDKLLDSSQPTCALCAVPQLIARTFCWPTPGQLVEAAAPNFGATDSQLPVAPGKMMVGAQAPPLSPPNPTTLDYPYVALGAAVGPSTVLSGGHASSVAVWSPVFTAPTGDQASYGFGKYSGSDAVQTGFPSAIVFPGVFGLCAPLWATPPS